MQRQVDRPITTAPAALKPLQGGYRELLAMVLRRRRVILAVALPIILVSAIGTLRSSDMVTAGTRVMIEGAQAEDPTFGAPRIVDYTVLMSSAAQVAVSIPVAERAAKALMDSLPSLASVAPQVAAMRRPDRVRDLLLRHVEANQIGESNILSIVFRHPSPRFGLMAVGALTNAYIDYNVESQQNTRAISYYTDQIRSVQSSVDTLMELRAGLRSAAGYSALQTNAAAGISQIMDIEKELVKARSRRQGLEERLKGLVAALAEDPDFVPTSGTAESPNLIGLKNKLDEANAKLAQLRIEYQEESEWVSRAKQTVAASQVELRKELGRFITNRRIELEEARQNEAAFAEAVAQQKAALVGYPETERRIDSLDMQIDSQRNLLRQLQLKRGEVALKVNTDMRVSNIVPLDTPSIATKVAGSKKFLYLALASVLALGLGLVSARFVDNADHRLYDRRRAEEYLQVPVLGAISQGREALR